MPQNKLQRIIFALLTVIITVHAFVFYSLWVVNGDALMNAAGVSSVGEAIRAQGGVYMRIFSAAHAHSPWLAVCSTRRKTTL